MNESREETVTGRVTDGNVASWHDRSVPLFALFLVPVSFLFLFTLLTVNNRRSAELSTNLYAVRSHTIIQNWLQNGYFRSAGMMAFKMDAQGNPTFYRAPGSYMASGYVVEKLHVLVRGRYNWRLLAVHNQVLSLILSALIALLAFRVARRFGVSWVHAFVLALSTEVVLFTFPDNLALYWEYYAQSFALIFATLFLLIEEREWHTGEHGVSWAQVAAAFALSHGEFVFGFLFLASYAAFHLLVARERLQWKSLLMKTAFPVALSLVVFALQVTWNSFQFPDAESSGHARDHAGFLFRTGLDGSDRYYRTHSDIVYGRDLARKIFPGHREQLLRWPWLFASGLAALAALVIAWFRGHASRVVILMLVAFIGGYLLYAAVFSQAVVIHPYLYDMFLVTPLILALFTAAPALFESRTKHTGFFVFIVVFGAIWCAFVQLRYYALRYPLSKETAAISPSAPKAAAPRVGEWKDIPYSPSIFTADRGAKWEVEQADITTLAYSIVGNTMTVAFRIVNTSVSGAQPTLLEIAIPEGRKARRAITNTLIATDNGAFFHTMAQAPAGSKTIQVSRPPTGLWAISRNQTRVIGQITIDVQ